MARSFAQVLKDQPGTSAVHVDTATRRRARTYSQVIADATRGLDAGMAMPSGGRMSEPGPTADERQKPDWRGHYLGRDGTGMEKFTSFAKVASVSDELGLVFGWAIVCTEKGEPYYDLNIDTHGEHAGKRVPEHIPEATMLKAAADFAATPDRPGNEMHDGPETGSYVFVWPMTADIAKAMGVTTEKTGLMIAYKPAPEVLAKFKDGTYKGFSIEGFRGESREHD